MIPATMVVVLVVVGGGGGCGASPRSTDKDKTGDLAIFLSNGGFGVDMMLESAFLGTLLRATRQQPSSSTSCRGSLFTPKMGFHVLPVCGSVSRCWVLSCARLQIDALLLRWARKLSEVGFHHWFGIQGMSI